MLERALTMRNSVAIVDSTLAACQMELSFTSDAMPANRSRIGMTPLDVRRAS
jgi:hypothetical protein